jgi:hypothetical protein
MTQGMFCFRLAVIAGVLFFMGQPSALAEEQSKEETMAR